MIFGAFSRVRRYLYKTGIVKTERLPRPVVSVGNLTMGGAGKTPHVIHLARWLSGQGTKVGILSRGYGRKSRGVRWVSYGDGLVATVAEAGDEPVLIAHSLPGIPVVVGESRAAAGRELLSTRAVDVFLLDDGFQHLSLARDADLLLVECHRGLGNGWTVPLGPLREPPSHARFADALLVTKCPDVEAGTRAVRAIPFPDDRLRAFTRLVPRGIVGRDGRMWNRIAIEDGVVAFSGLARNEHFLETLADAGIRVHRFLPYPDHHMFGQRDIGNIARAAGKLPAVTTEKDLVRLPRSVPFPVGALRVEVEYLLGWDALSRWILARLRDGGPS